ncbi:MAG: hypothetical protein HY942_00330 [Gammaproteobacteria bacterium]|nr:hypothetical protein [Gammaproteobacteria bacterium]
MKIDRILTTGVALVVLLACAAVPAWADRERRDDGRLLHRDYPGDVRQSPEQYKERGWVHDNRYRHDHYYPPRGHVVPVLPPGHRVVPYHGSHYYFHGGIWYRPYGPRFTVVFPPIGLVVPVLPPYYTTIWVGGAPYYYAGGVYYAWRPDARGYVVTEPPPEADVREPPAVPEQLFVYPKKGQGEQQLAADRYQCHRWSADQTGFDPTQPGGNVPEGQHAVKRTDYQRAMKACLEARGYSVQ